jgi:hypothetical protein
VLDYDRLTDAELDAVTDAQLERADSPPVLAALARVHRSAAAVLEDAPGVALWRLAAAAAHLEGYMGAEGSALLRDVRALCGEQLAAHGHREARAEGLWLALEQFVGLMERGLFTPR